MSEARKTFCKEERLCSVKIINQLFEEGKVFHTSLFRVVWDYTASPQTFPARAGFSVPKKKFRLAVTRNLIKRRMREAWRKNKSRLYEHLNEKNKNISLFLVVSAKTVPDYSSTEKAVNDAINKLISLI